MNNKLLISLLSVAAVIGLAFIYYEQGTFEQEETEYEPANFDSDDSEEEADSFEGYGVSASHPLAVEAGMEILDNGGNAADAAVTVSYVLSVVEPYGSGVGGGGEMLVLPEEDDEPDVYQYREMAPLSGNEPETFAIPGFVHGMDSVNDDLGSMDMEDLIDPAIDYAEDGFKADDNLVNRLKKGARRMDVGQMEASFFPKGDIIDVNDKVKQKDLAETLKAIKDDGPEAFYEGEIADDILDHMEDQDDPEIDMHYQGEIPETDDFRDYESEMKEAAHGTFAGYDVYAAPPPLAGVTFIQSLQMAEALDIEEVEDNEADYIHLMGEISQQAYSDRVDSVGDTNMTDADPAETLTSQEYTDDLAESISLDERSDNDEVNDSTADEEDHDNTTHFVIIDEEGTMVSATHTLGNFFGSGDYVDGFFLNNQMENYSHSSDSLNYLEPGKISRSFTSPAILTNDDETIGIGSPGGKRIPMVMAEVLTQHLLFDKDLQEANDEERFYVEDDGIFTEEEIDPDTRTELESLNYTVYEGNETPEFFGGIQVLTLDKAAEAIKGISDDRRGGTWKADSGKDEEE